MYFLPGEDVKSCRMFPRLENSIKLKREVDLPLEPMRWEYFKKSGSDLFFYLIDWVTGEIRSRKFDHNRVVQNFMGDKLPYLRAWGTTYCFIYFDSLPIIGPCYSRKGLKNIKFSFYAIPGITPGRIRMEDLVLDIGCVFRTDSVCVSSSYVAVIIVVYDYEPTVSLMPGLRGTNRRQNQTMT